MNVPPQDKEVLKKVKMTIKKEVHDLSPVCRPPRDLVIYRVTFLTGPAQKSSKYGTGPTQQQKITKYTGPTQG